MWHCMLARTGGETFEEHCTRRESVRISCFSEWVEWRVPPVSRGGVCNVFGWSFSDKVIKAGVFSIGFVEFDGAMDVVYLVFEDIVTRVWPSVSETIFLPDLMTNQSGMEEVLGRECWHCENLSIALVISAVRRNTTLSTFSLFEVGKFEASISLRGVTSEQHRIVVWGKFWEGRNTAREVEVPFDKDV